MIKIIIISEWLPWEEKKQIIREQLKEIYKPGYAKISNKNVVPFIW